MKIVSLAPSNIPSRAANAVQIIKMCEAMAATGEVVDLLVPGARRSTRADDVWEQYGVQSRFQLRWLPSRKGLRGHDFAAHAALYARVRGADLVHAIHLPGAAWAATARIPVVLELHDMPRGLMGQRYVRAVVQARGFRRVVTITHRLRDALVRAGLPPDAVVVAPNGVDLKPFQDLPDPTEARRRLKLGDTPVIGYSGQLYEGRGMGIALDIAERVRDATLLVIGGEDYSVAQLRTKAAQRGLDNVRILGHVPHAEVPSHLAACDILLMPYQTRVAVSGGGDTANWMNPMKMFEYLASGRAIVTSDMPTIREVLDESVAVFCPPAHVESWVSAVRSLLEDPGSRLLLGQAARERVKAHAWNQRAEAVLTSALG